MFGNRKNYIEKGKKKILEKLELIDNLKKKLRSETRENKIEKIENKIIKIKEDIKKMVGKLQLKDGKIVKESEVVEQPVKEQQMPYENEVQEPIVEAQNVEQSYQPPQFAANRVVPPEAIPPVPQQADYMQGAVPQQADYMQGAVPPQMPPQMPPQQIKVKLVLDNNTIFNVVVGGYEFEDFVRKTEEAIDNQSSVVIGNKLINGRHIVMLEY